MHDETVETYINVYARWFAIISQFIVTASLCTLWRLQMTRYSQVLVHSTVVNSQLSHQYMSISPSNTVIRNGNLYEPGPPAYTYVNLPLPCVHAGAFLRFMSIISYRILVAKRSDS